LILGFRIGFLEISWVDVIDVLLVTVLLFQVYKLMRGSVAVKIFLGFLSLYLIYLVVRAAEMELLSNILGQFMGVGVLAALILFQQEIRKFLLLIGRTTFNRESLLGTFRSFSNRRSEFEYITPIMEALRTLSGTNTGALIVVSVDSELKSYQESGDIIDAQINRRLLQAIFNKTSPLHDGAAIIYKDRIKAARCILPVTERQDIPAQYGLRHRAAVGMSETTDVFIIVVSEETGQISIVKNGQHEPNLSLQEVRSSLKGYLSGQEGLFDNLTRRARSEKPKAEKAAKPAPAPAANGSTAQVALNPEEQEEVAAK